MELKTLKSDDVRHLVSICGPERVLFGSQISEDYGHDELSLDIYLPDVVVEPVCTNEVREILSYAYGHNLAVTPRGAGTGLCGGAVAIHGGIVLSLAKMNRILEIDNLNLMAVVEPGVLLLDFQQRVEQEGLFYPPDPGEKTATIGGNMSTNAGGMRAVKYGVTRDYCIGLEAVLPDGRLIEVGGKVVKNSSGYSLLDLLVGSEGTLAIITRITVKLLPKPEKQISLLVPYSSLEQAISSVPPILSSKVTPAAVEFLQREVLEAAEKYLGRSFPDSSAPAYLLLTFYGNDMVELERVYEQVAQVCLDCQALDVYIANTADRQESLWQTRGAFLEALKGMSELEEVDVVVPPHAIAEFVGYTEQLRQQYGLRILSFGHAGDGNLHIYILRDQAEREEWLEEANKIMEAMYSKAKTLRGQVSGEHGIGYAKGPFLVNSLGSTQIELLRGIKAVFDPKGILNPGKVCS